VQTVEGAVGLGLAADVRDAAAAAADAAEAKLRAERQETPTADDIADARYRAAEGVLEPARHMRGEFRSRF
jgi:hypothetical protein